MLAPEHARLVLRVPLTPLIDVVFILLLFFMLSSSFARQQQIEFRTASTSAGAATDDARRVLLLAGGRVEVDGEHVAVDSTAFARQLDDWRGKPGKVIVAAMHDVPVQELVGLLDRLHATQLDRVDLAASVRP